MTQKYSYLGTNVRTKGPACNDGKHVLVVPSTGYKDELFILIASIALLFFLNIQFKPVEFNYSLPAMSNFNWFL